MPGRAGRKAERESPEQAAPQRPWWEFHPQGNRPLLEGGGASVRTLPGGTGSPKVCPGCLSAPLSYPWLGTSWAQDGHQSHQHLRQEDGVGRVLPAPVKPTGGRTFPRSPSGLPLPRLASRTGNAGIPAVRHLSWKMKHQPEEWPPPVVSYHTGWAHLLNVTN